MWDSPQMADNAQIEGNLKNENSPRHSEIQPPLPSRLNHPSESDDGDTKALFGNNVVFFA